MQTEITEKAKLLTPSGKLAEKGYSKELLLEYERKSIKANSLRIKEWDYYLIANQKFGVALTIADNSYMGLDSITFLDLGSNPWEKTVSPMQFMPLGSKGLPSTSITGDVYSGNKKYSLSFKNNGTERRLSFRMLNFRGSDSIEGEFVLQNVAQQSMVIATPFDGDDKAFYYNQKINCLPASGQVKLGDETYIFDKKDTFAVLDWGRGVWTYKNTWYWGSASGKLDGESFGFNIGYGFGNTTAATENMLFYKGKAHKLSKVKFEIPRKDGKEDYMSTWRFTSDDGRFEMSFVPIIDRASKTDVKLICSDQHQVFGRFSGTAVLDDGTKLVVSDFLGFAEKVFNKW